MTVLGGDDKNGGADGQKGEAHAKKGDADGKKGDGRAQKDLTDGNASFNIMFETLVNGGCMQDSDDESESTMAPLENAVLRGAVDVEAGAGDEKYYEKIRDINMFTYELFVEEEETLADVYVNNDADVYVDEGGRGLTPDMAGIRKALAESSANGNSVSTAAEPE